MLERPTCQTDDIVLEIRDATRRFGSRSVLSGIHLTLVAGQIFVLIGPNGAGKTTLVRAISGRLPLQSGTIHILGRLVGSGAMTRHYLGLVPQSIALYPHLTARENLQVMGRLSGLRGRAAVAAADAALASMGLAARANERTANLSGGMQRRLNIAAGTLHRPRLLLLDEPTVGVDLRARESIHDFLRQLRREGMGILLTTHDLDQAAELADCIGILSRGRLIAVGTPASLVRRVFGEAKELVVRLARKPDERGRLFLEEQGLTAAKGQKHWSGRLPGGLREMSELAPRLSERGLVVEEVRLREPSLRGVFLHLTGEELRS
ncbi:MAG: ABC transporter ATP-binding protein [Gammaproteobacteria bacterium]